MGETDILGWSFGGLAAQVLAINCQRLVRKVILAARIPHSPAASVSVTAMAARSSAIRRFASNADGWYARLKQIAAPTFVANGDRDGLFPAVDSAVLAREIPWSRLGIYPDSGHAFLFQ